MIPLLSACQQSSELPSYEWKNAHDKIIYFGLDFFFEDLHSYEFVFEGPDFLRKFLKSSLSKEDFLNLSAKLIALDFFQNEAVYIILCGKYDVKKLLNFDISRENFVFAIGQLKALNFSSYQAECILLHGNSIPLVDYLCKFFSTEHIDISKYNLEKIKIIFEKDNIPHYLYKYLMSKKRLKSNHYLFNPLNNYTLEDQQFSFANEFKLSLTVYGFSEEQIALIKNSSDPSLFEILNSLMRFLNFEGIIANNIMSFATEYIASLKIKFLVFFLFYSNVPKEMVIKKLNQNNLLQLTFLLSSETFNELYTFLNSSLEGQIQACEKRMTEKLNAWLNDNNCKRPKQANSFLIAPIILIENQGKGKSSNLGSQKTLNELVANHLGNALPYYNSSSLFHSHPSADQSQSQSLDSATITEIEAQPSNRN